MSQRAALRLEFASIVVIAAAMLLFGWVVLQNIARFGLLSATILIAVAVLQFAAIRRNLAAGGEAARIRATRDVAFIAAALLGAAYVLWLQRWTIGACIAMLEFALILELLTRATTLRPGSDA